MNVRHNYEGQQKLNPNLNKCSDPNDIRLDWLLDNFLGYFDQWSVEVENKPDNFNCKDRSSMMLNHQTLTGLKITTKSVVEMVRYLLNHGVKYVFTSAFNRDPLEQHFGHYSIKGDHPITPQ